MFPNNSQYQNLLVVASGPPTHPCRPRIPARPPPAWSAAQRDRLSIESAIRSLWAVKASYQHAGDWSETIGRLYARYIFDGDVW